MFQTKSTLRAALLAGAAALALSSGALAQSAATDAAKPHHHQAATTGSDRLELLEKRVEQQADALAQQAGEIQALKAQLTQAAASPPVTSTQFAALQSKVDEQAAATKAQATVSFKAPSAQIHGKTRLTIATADGKWSISPYILVQGDFASYSNGQPLPNGPTNGKNDLKSSGENFRRAQLGFQGAFAGDFGYAFVYDFGGSNGDETYQGYAGPNSGTIINVCKTLVGTTCTAWTTASTASFYNSSTGAGSGPHIQQAWLSYKGILDPFTFKIGAFATPANLNDMTSSADLLFNERPSPAQLSRGLDGDDGRESVGFQGNGSIWNASLFFTGDTFGKGALLAPQSTSGGSQEAVVGRLAVAPWYDPDTNFNIHLGANVGYVIHPQEATTNTPSGLSGFTTYGITFSDRPELRVDNVTFLNTGAIDAKSAYSAGLEAAFSYGPFLVQGENFWYGITRDNPGTPVAGITNPNFSGWYVEGSWVLTGEPRVYSMASASYVRPSPAEPFDPANGDWGAWELAGRYSSADLNYDVHSTANYTYTEPGTGASTLKVADAVFGGQQNIWSVGLNFYPNDALKFMLDYQDVRLKDIGAFGNNGSYNTINLRTQVSF